MALSRSYGIQWASRINWIKYKQLFHRLEWRDSLPDSLGNIAPANPLYQLLQVIWEKTNDTPSRITNAEQLITFAILDNDFYQLTNFEQYQFANGKEYIMYQLGEIFACSHALSRRFGHNPVRETQLSA